MSELIPIPSLVSSTPEPGRSLALKPGHTVRVGSILADTLGGRIWRGLWLEAQTPVALKTVHPACRVGSSAWQVQACQLRREADLLARWRDPSVLALWGWAELPSGPLLMLEMLHESLHARLMREPAHCIEALRLGLQATQAVAKLHQVGLKHLDVKPANFLMRPPGIGWPARLLLADFGSCHALTSANHHPVGTPGWAPPEALQTDAQGQAHTGPYTDLYALGLLLFGLLAGRLPHHAQAQLHHYRAHQAQYPGQVWTPLPISALAHQGHLAPDDQLALAQALSCPPLPAHMVQALQAVLYQCLQPEPTRRLASTAPLANALAQALACGV